MIVATASRKASPGATTLAVLLAAEWSGAEARLVIEADPSGGTLAARWSTAHGLTWDPGLLNLSTSRVGVGRVDLLDTMAQQVGESLWVSAAPPSPEQVSGSLVRLGDPGAAALAAATDLVAFADCGRLSLRSPALPLAVRSALTILVCRPRLDEVHTLQPAVAELRSVGCTLGLVCIGDGPYPPDEVAGSLGVELLGAIPIDVRAMTAFEDKGLTAGRAFQRSGLRSNVAELADRVRQRAVDLLRPRVLESYETDVSPAGSPNGATAPGTATAPPVAAPGTGSNAAAPGRIPPQDGSQPRLQPPDPRLRPTHPRPPHPGPPDPVHFDDPWPARSPAADAPPGYPHPGSSPRSAGEWVAAATAPARNGNNPAGPHTPGPNHHG